MNFFWFDVVGLSTWETTGASIGSYAYRMLNLRAIYLEEIEGSRKDAFDYYAFVRNAYLSNRQARVLDSTDAAAAVDEDLYEFDEEEGDEENYDLDLDDEAGAEADGEPDAEEDPGDAGDASDPGDADSGSEASNEGEPASEAVEGAPDEDETGGEHRDGED